MEAVGLGSKFQIKSGTTYTDIAMVSSITPPQISVDDVEIEDIDPVDGYKRYLPGLKDGGEVTVTLNFDPADTGQTSLADKLEAQTIEDFRIVYPNGTDAWSFKGYVKGYAPQDLGASDVMQVEVTIKVTGKPTLGTITP